MCALYVRDVINLTRRQGFKGYERRQTRRQSMRTKGWDARASETNGASATTQDTSAHLHHVTKGRRRLKRLLAAVTLAPCRDACVRVQRDREAKPGACWTRWQRDHAGVRGEGATGDDVEGVLDSHILACWHLRTINGLVIATQGRKRVSAQLRICCKLWRKALVRILFDARLPGATFASQSGACLHENVNRHHNTTVALSCTAGELLASATLQSSIECQVSNDTHMTHRTADSHISRHSKWPHLHPEAQGPLRRAAASRC